MRVRTRGGEGQGQVKVKDRGVHTNSEAHSGDGNSDGDAIMSKVRQADEQGAWDADEGRRPWRRRWGRWRGHDEGEATRRAR